jgi:hypothetical protein
MGLDDCNKIVRNTGKTREEIGRIAEDIIEKGLRRFGAKYIRNKINGKGADFRIWSNNGIIESEGELKNNFGDYYWTPDMVKRECLSRFQSSDPQHRRIWFLLMAVAKFSNITDDIIKKKYGVHIIEWGKQVLSRKETSIIKVIRTLMDILNTLETMVLKWKDKMFDNNIECIDSFINNNIIISGG